MTKSCDITVRPVNDNDDKAWDTFVFEQPDATLFHCYGWQRVVERAYGYRSHYLLAESGERKICGILPLVEIKTMFFGHALISTAFFVYGGILASNPRVIEALASAAADLADHLGVDYLELRGREPSVCSWSIKSALYAGFRCRLLPDEAANLKRVPRKKRADIRKSLTNGLTYRENIDPAEFYGVYAESLRNLGTPVFSIRFVEAIVEEFGDIVHLSAVDQDGRAVATLLSFFFRDEVMPYYGGALPAARPVHAYDFLYWRLLCRSLARGVAVFDFGRSKLGTGAYNYKRFWGFEPEPLHYQYYLVKKKVVPDINPANPRYRLFIDGWRRLPLAVTNRLGPMIARQLG